MVHQRNRRIYSVQGFFSYFDALWFDRCWINLFSKEMQNLFLDFWIQSWIFLKKTHPSVLPVHLTSVKILRGSVRDKRQHVYASWGAWLGDVGRHTRLQLSIPILLLLLSIFRYNYQFASVVLLVESYWKWSKIQNERHTYLNSMYCLSSKRDTLSQFFSNKGTCKNNNMEWSLPAKSPIYAAISLGNFNHPTFCLIYTISTWLGVRDKTCRGSDVCNAIGANCWKHKKETGISIIICGSSVRI